MISSGSFMYFPQATHLDFMNDTEEIMPRVLLAPRPLTETVSVTATVAVTVSATVTVDRGRDGHGSCPWSCPCPPF